MHLPSPIAALIVAVSTIPLLGQIAWAAPARFASFNTFFNRPAAGALIDDLSTTDNPQAQAVAEIIQRTRPDVLLLKEVDYDAEGQAVQHFQANYLAVSQNAAEPILYPYVYVPPTNTGVASGYDLDNNGLVEAEPGSRAYGGDAFGFGEFEGQYGFVILSKYPILTEQIRTFQTFLWADMPEALLPDNLDTSKPMDWFSEEELSVVRLSSKNHVDVPIDINGEIIHVLASHPTPPVFDGAEDRNGRRNFDEIRLWADYITPRRAEYLYDDTGKVGGLDPGKQFVIMGDLNADPLDGEGRRGAIAQLLGHPLVNTSLIPASDGATIDGANDPHAGPAAQDTGNFGRLGNYRLDYVLPSRNLTMLNATVFWPTPDDPLYRLVGDGNQIVSSDHRLVMVDVDI